MSRHIGSRHLMSHEVNSRHMALHNVTLRHITSNHATACHLASTHTILRRLMSCRDIARHITPSHATTSHLMSCHVMSRHATNSLCPADFQPMSAHVSHVQQFVEVVVTRRDAVRCVPMRDCARASPIRRIQKVRGSPTPGQCGHAANPVALTIRRSRVTTSRDPS